MIEYIYKGFKLSYKISHLVSGNSSYKADGELLYLLNTPSTFAPKKFQMEDETYSGAEHEIKKILENHVDYELKRFYDMEKEHASR